MKAQARNRIEWLARGVLGDEEYQRLKSMPIVDVGFGYDSFGLERETVIAAYLAMRQLYQRYFRVDSEGHANIPVRGRALLIANHSGIVPLDGTMIGIDLLKHLNPPRLVRAAVDNFVAALPFLGLLFARLGQITGTRRNMIQLMERDELVLIFPEGTRGVGKRYSERYRLQRFTVGFVELALATRTPIIPTAVIGAEEQAPLLAKSKVLGRMLGMPFVPVTPTFPLMGPLGLIPYPSKYHILYGEPMLLHEQHGPDAVGDSKLVERLCGEVRERVQALVKEGLKRPHGLQFLTGDSLNGSGKKLLKKFRTTA